MQVQTILNEALKLPPVDKASVIDVSRQELKLLSDDPDSELELRYEISEQLKYQTELFLKKEKI